MSDTPKPIPAPLRQPVAVFSTTGLQSTLKEQMHLGDNLEKFYKLIRIIRTVATKHIDFSVGYRWQNTDDIKIIRQEILSRCPELGRDYADAWPIITYLKIRLKHQWFGPRDPAGLKRRIACQKSETTGRFIKNVPNKSVFRSHSPAIVLRGLSDGKASMEPKLETTTSTTSRLTSISSIPRRSSRLTSNAVKDLSESKIYRGHERGRSASSDSEDEAMAEPNENVVLGERLSHKADKWLARLEAQEKDSAPEPPLEEQGSGLSKVRTSGRSRPVVFIHYDAQAHSKAYQSSKPAFSLAERPGSSARSTDKGRTHPTRSTSASEPNSGPAASSSHTEPPAAVRDMLLAYALPRADADRIALLLAGKGIASVAYLRVFAGLGSREAWLLEMCEAGLLSEVQSRVVCDMLDAISQDD
ncbi:hypothetical protein C2E23DRAFT_215198 [Lenzites betulinus]|nr:hypothetical protein C2E23DRAFT_215198 [Lenzites betulinus]